jgi:hypothetical protein
MRVMLLRSPEEGLGEKIAFRFFFLEKTSKESTAGFLFILNWIQECEGQQENKDGGQRQHLEAEILNSRAQLYALLGPEGCSET